jgi:methionyl-tRNA formyltransferase
LPRLLAGSAVAVPQSTEGVSYAGRLAKAEGRIDWRQPAAVIERRIRAFDPWPGSETGFRGERLRVWSAQLSDAASDATAAPGTVVASGAAGCDVVTGSGVLRLTSVQMPGRQRVSAADFARGYAVLGEVLGN